MTPTKMLSLFLSFCLILEQGVFAQTIDLSRYFARNSASAVSQSDKFRPLHLRYVSYDNQANDFKILLDKGDFFNQQTPQLPNSSTPKLEEATQELMKYFFIGLALPNEKFWVNLRPDSPDNILDPDLEKTDIGRIFLEADLQLKKDTSGMTSPQTKEGKEYWDKLYKKAGELFGSENITIPTLTRPWIVPDEVIIRESPEGAYIYKATLKVMLEEDYLNQKTEKPKDRKTEIYSFSDPRLKELNEYSTQLIKESIIPRLTKEINSARRYAPLRQVYYSLILAQWFKQKYSSSGSIRAPGISAPVNSCINLIDSGNLANLASTQPYDKQTYFQQYQKSFKDGEYNLQEPVYTPMGQSIRRHMSGGAFLGSSSPTTTVTGNKNMLNFKWLVNVEHPNEMIRVASSAMAGEHFDESKKLSSNDITEDALKVIGDKKVGLGDDSGGELLSIVARITGKNYGDEEILRQIKNIILMIEEHFKLNLQLSEKMTQQKLQKLRFDIINGALSFSDHEVIDFIFEGKDGGSEDEPHETSTIIDSLLALKEAILTIVKGKRDNIKLGDLWKNPLGIPGILNGAVKFILKEQKERRRSEDKVDPELAVGLADVREHLDSSKLDYARAYIIFEKLKAIKGFFSNKASKDNEDMSKIIDEMEKRDPYFSGWGKEKQEEFIRYISEKKEVIRRLVSRRIKAILSWIKISGMEETLVDFLSQLEKSGVSSEQVYTVLGSFTWIRGAAKFPAEYNEKETKEFINNRLKLGLTEENKLKMLLLIRTIYYEKGYKRNSKLASALMHFCVEEVRLKEKDGGENLKQKTSGSSAILSSSTSSAATGKIPPKWIPLGFKEEELLYYFQSHLLSLVAEGLVNSGQELHLDIEENIQYHSFSGKRVSVEGSVPIDQFFSGDSFLAMHCHPAVVKDNKLVNIVHLPSLEDLRQDYKIVIIVWGDEGLGFYATEIDMAKANIDEYAKFGKNEAYDERLECLSKSQAVQFYKIEINPKDYSLYENFLRKEIYNSIHNEVLFSVKPITIEDVKEVITKIKANLSFVQKNDKRREDIWKKHSYYGMQGKPLSVIHENKIKTEEEMAGIYRKIKELPLENRDERIELEYELQVIKSVLEGIDRALEESKSVASPLLLVPQGDTSNPGGIDLSHINKIIRRESVSSPGSGGLNNPVDVDFDVNEELGRLQNMINAQIIPSASRLDRYARAARASLAFFPDSSDSALSLIAETFRLQEEKSVSAPDELKALAAWLEQSG